MTSNSTRIAIVAIALSLGTFTGCDQLAQTSAKGAHAVVSENPCPTAKVGDSNRFKTVDVYPVGMRQNLALDSSTGQMCRTWNWQTSGGRSPYNRFPTCASLSGQPEGEPGLIAGQ
jgi:hypothetical protein